MRWMATCAAVCVMLMAAVVYPDAQRVTLSGDVLKDWRSQRETMTRIAEAMPDDRFEFRATPAERSYREQILHVAGANIMLMKFLGARTAAPPITDADLSMFGLKATTKADTLRELQRSYAFGEAALQEFTDEALLQTVTGPRWIGETTRAKMAYYTMGHALDIYGQMVVYLRLNGIVPPASRRGGV